MNSNKKSTGELSKNSVKFILPISVFIFFLILFNVSGRIKTPDMGEIAIKYEFSTDTYSAENSITVNDKCAVRSGNFFKFIKLTTAEKWLIYAYSNYILKNTGLNADYENRAPYYRYSVRIELGTVKHRPFTIKDKMFVIMILGMFYARAALPVWITLLFFVVFAASLKKPFFENRRKSICFAAGSAAVAAMLGVVFRVLFCRILYKYHFFCYGGTNIAAEFLLTAAETALISMLSAENKKREVLLYIIPAAAVGTIGWLLFSKTSPDMDFSNDYTMLWAVKRVLFGSCGMFPLYPRLFAFTFFLCVGFVLFFTFGCFSKRKFEENAARSLAYACVSALPMFFAGFVPQHIFAA